MTAPGEEVSVFTYPYLGAGAPAQSEAKGLIKIIKFIIINIIISLKNKRFILYFTIFFFNKYLMSKQKLKTEIKLLNLEEVDFTDINQEIKR